MSPLTVLSRRIAAIALTGTLTSALLAASIPSTSWADDVWNSGGYNTGGYNNGYGQPAPANTGMAPLQGYVVTAPAGTYMSATISSPLTSEYSRVGDRFTATLGSPVAGNGGVILPAGSQLEGQVVYVKPAGMGNRNGQIEVRFTAARTPGGQSIPISARIQTEDGTGVIKGSGTAGSVGRVAAKTAIGAGLGAALGTAMGPLSGGSVGRGAIYGTAVGGGMGLLAAGASKGKEAVIPSGQPVNIVLDQPLTAAPDAGGGYGQPAPAYSQPYGGGGYTAPANTTPAPSYSPYGY